jgi:hypothetical protein
MRYLIGGQMDWIAVPAIILVGAAYAWVVSRVLSPKTMTGIGEQTASVDKAA